MKILMTLMGLDLGGAETHVVELAKELTRRGHEVVIASSGGVYVRELEGVGIRHVTIPMNRRSAGRMLKSLRLLRQTIRREKPDLVHAHARIPAFLCGILQRQMRFPFLTTAHWVFEVTPLLRLVTDWGQRTVAVSEDIKTYLMENYRVPSEQIDVTVNGIDTDLFCPARPEAALRTELGLGDGPVVELVSRLDGDRSLAAEQLITLAPELERDTPGLTVLIVGGGDQEERLRRQAQEINRSLGRQVVCMAGRRTDIPRLLALASVFVGVSRAALEAMSAERPVILAGNEGYLGLLTEETLAAAQKTNFCCRDTAQTDPEALRRDIQRVLAMPEPERQALGAFGRRVIVDSYSVARMTEDYLRAYDRLLHPAARRTAVISGYYGYGNLGDDALLWAIHQQLAAKDIGLVVLSRRPGQTTRQYGLRAVQRFSPWAVRRAIGNADVLISGGGSLLQDRTSTRSLCYYLWVIRQAEAMGKPVFLWANGIGPLDRQRNRRRVRRTLAACGGITLRDEDSRAELTAMGLTGGVVTGDPALLLTPCSPTEARRCLVSQGIPLDRGLVGISVRQAPGMNTAELAALGDEIVRELGRNVVWLPMQEPVDRTLSRQLQAQMRCPSHVLQPVDRPELLLGIIGCMDAVVSMRLHTLVFAARCRVPMIGCIYDPKVEALLRLLGMPDCGTPETVTAQHTLELLRDLLDREEEVRALLARRTGPLERQAGQTVQYLLDLLERRGAEP